MMQQNQSYLTGAGNIVILREIKNGYAFLDRVGYLDSDGDSHEKYDRTWAKVAEEWLNDIQYAFQPAVRLIGGNWMLEADYAEMQIHSQES